MRKWIRGLSGALLAVLAAAPVLACMAIPMRPSNDPRVQMHLTEQRALIYQDKGEEHLVLSVKYEGATPQFAWVIPTETRPQIAVQKGAPFHELWRLTEIRRPTHAMAPAAAAGGIGSLDKAVQVVERKVEGPYELIVLRGDNGSALYEWLSRNGFGLTTDSRQALDYYAQKGWYFACARLRPGGADNASIQKHLRDGTIAALHLHYKATRLSYPLRVTAGNPGDSKMEIYVIGGRVQAPRMLEALQFELRPQGSQGFAVSGPPGLVSNAGDYPALRAMLAQGGTLHKFTGVMTTAERNADLVFCDVARTVSR
jgi:hypothetical protein